MPLRTFDLKAPFLAALYAIGYPAEMKEIADWINANVPVVRGPVKNNGTLGRTRDALIAEGAIERDAGRYRRAARKKPQPKPVKPAVHRGWSWSETPSSTALSIQPANMRGAEHRGRSGR